MVRYHSRMRRSKTLVSIGIVLVLFAFSLLGHGSPTLQKAAAGLILASSTPQTGYYAIVNVVDGDTFKALIDNAAETVRLIGIDTPETKDPRKPVQCFGKEASAMAHSILDGQRVRLEADPSQDNRDKYGRLLRYAYLPDGTSFNKMMIEEGYAHEYTYAIPYQFQTEFKAAENAARAANRGLWASTTCNGDTKKAAS
jgi:micrococcal nuclease